MQHLSICQNDFYASAPETAVARGDTFSGCLFLWMRYGKNSFMEIS